MSTTNKPKLWFWIIAILGLLWNAYGVSAYLLTAYKVESVREVFTEEQLALVDATPSWLIGAFAIAVFSGFLGSILLLLRRKFAIFLFGISLLCVLIKMITEWFTTAKIEVFGTVEGIVLPLTIIVVAIFLYFYSKGAKQRGWLK